MSEETERLLREKNPKMLTLPMKNLTIQGVTGRSSKIKKTVQVEMVTGDAQHDVRFLVAPKLMTSTVLGMSWMDESKARLDFRDYVMRYSDKEGKRYETRLLDNAEVSRVQAIEAHESEGELTEESKSDESTEEDEESRQSDESESCESIVEQEATEEEIRVDKDLEGMEDDQMKLGEVLRNLAMTVDQIDQGEAVEEVNCIRGGETQNYRCEDCPAVLAFEELADEHRKRHHQVAVLKAVPEEGAWQAVNEIKGNHQEVFSKRPGLCKVFECRLEVLDKTPFALKSYPIPFSKKKSVDDEIKRMLDCGVIEHSSSPFSNPIVVVTKKNGSARLCLDARRLNKVLVADRESPPVMDELIQNFHGVRTCTWREILSWGYEIDSRESE